MSIDKMTEMIMNIQSDLMFHEWQGDSSSLLAAVEELRYYLKYEMQVPINDTITVENGTFVF